MGQSYTIVLEQVLYEQQNPTIYLDGHLLNDPNEKIRAPLPFTVFEFNGADVDEEMQKLVEAWRTRIGTKITVILESG